MKLKYYMRGLGIGVAVTALILGIAAGSKSPGMTDEQIMARARELGMIESTVLASMKEDNTGTEAEETGWSKPDGQSAAEPDTSPAETKETQTLPEENKKVPVTPETSQSEPETVPDKTIDGEDASEIPDVNAAEIVTLTIKGGESSVSVSKSLAAAGLVQDAAAYDKFLCTNGYDKSISVGTYKIPAGSNEEAIAKIITKQN